MERGTPESVGGRVGTLRAGCARGGVVPEILSDAPVKVSKKAAVIGSSGSATRALRSATSTFRHLAKLTRKQTVLPVHQSHAGSDLFPRAPVTTFGSLSKAEDLLLVFFVRLSLRKGERHRKKREGLPPLLSPLAVPRSPSLYQNPLAALSVAMLELYRSREPRRRRLYMMRRRGGQSQSLRSRRSGARMAGSSLAA